MKLLFLRLFMLISCVAMLASCGEKSRNQDASGTIKTQVPLPDGKGGYSLQITELLGIDYLYGMSGQYAQFFMGPDVVNGHLTGQAPRTRFIKSDDLYIAADSLSLQLATVYSHTQKLAALDVELGVGSVNKWPRDIGVGVRMPGDLRNNAFYDGETDAMLFVPYTGSNLPLAVNAGILAHEHFHSLFYKIVTIPLNTAGKNPQKVSDTVHSREDIYKAFDLPHLKNISADGSITNQVAYHILLMRGLNEGIADFWGWLYTGDTDFIAYSLPEEKSARTLTTLDDDTRLELKTSYTLQFNVGQLTPNPKTLVANLNSEAYLLGTQYSRILKIFTDAYAQNRQLSLDAARKQMAKLILKALPDFKTDIMNLQADEYYEPSTFMLSFFAGIDDARQDECQIIAEVMGKSQSALNYTCESKDKAFVLTSKPTTGGDLKSLFPPNNPDTSNVRFK